MSRRTLLRVLAVPLAALAACASQGDQIAESQRLAALGNYYLAYKVLEEVRDPDHPEADLEAAYWAARLEYLIERGRRLVFIDRLTEGLENLNQALTLAPANPRVLELIDRANEKLASRAVEEGNSRLAQGALELALLSFTEAQRFVPGFGPAITGTERVREQFDQMHRKAQEHFLQALRSFPQLQWVRVDWHATAALENDPARADARELQSLAKRKEAERCIARATMAEKNGQYGAALMEYRSARDFHADLPEIDARIAHMEREVEAQTLAENAYMHVISGEFGKARELLAKAAGLTVLEKTQVSDMMLQTRKREADQRYIEARDLELQDKKAEALAAFQAIAAQWPDGLRDEKVRIDNLEHDIAKAEAAWTAAEAAEQSGDKAAALEQYRTVDTYYPGWKDVRERIARLQGQRP